MAGSGSCIEVHSGVGRCPAGDQNAGATFQWLLVALPPSVAIQRKRFHHHFLHCTYFHAVPYILHLTITARSVNPEPDLIAGTTSIMKLGDQDPNGKEALYYTHHYKAIR
jgi:hypothetical protein